MADNVKHANDSSFESDVLRSSTPVLVDFTATWCQPCKALAPKVEQVANEYAGRVKVVKVDVDNSQRTAMAYNIRSVPTLLVFKGGQVVGQLIGNVDKGRITDMVNGAL